MLRKPSAARSALLMAALLVLSQRGDFPARVAGQERPLPEAGKELSSVAGVSIVRMAEKTTSSEAAFSAAEGKGKLTAEGKALLEVLTFASGLHPARVFERAPLPGGVYKIRVEAEELPKAFRLLADAYAGAFSVRITREKRDIAVLILTADDNWPKDGFRGSAKKQWRWSGSTEKRLDGGELHAYKFEGADMDNIADWLEEKGGKVVLNETGIKGRFEGQLESRGGAELADLEKGLLKHALRLKPAKRMVEGVFIEAAKK